MPEIIINLSQTEYDAMSVLTSTPEEWINHAVKNKSRKMINELVEMYSDKQPNKTNESEKKDIINSIDLVKERDNRRGKRVA